MKDCTRGQVSPFPMPLVLVVVVAVTIYVGWNVVETMSTQLPSGEVVVCGGGCEGVLGSIGLVMLLFLVLLVAFLLRSGIMGRFSR